MKRHFKTPTVLWASLFALFIIAGCSGSTSEQTASESSTEQTLEANADASNTSADPMSNKGIGPVASVELGTLDQALADKGKTVFEGKCAACHKFDSKYVGPSLGGVTTRRTPEWIMNMVMNPVEMTQKDPIASELLAEYLTQMTYQNVSEEETRSILEYFRSVDAQQ